MSSCAVKTCFRAIGIRQNLIFSDILSESQKRTYDKDGFYINRCKYGGLEDRLKVQYPNLKYHVLDTSKINTSLWQRNDYPFEMFFEDELDESVLDWKPTSREPSMLDAGVQARINAASGKYAIVVPPALEEKLENNPELSQSILPKMSTLIKEQERNQRLAAKRALERKEQLEKAELDKRYQQSLL